MTQMHLLPPRIVQRIGDLTSEVQRITEGALALLKTELPARIRLRYTNSAPRDVLTTYERSQSVAFVTRYERLPEEVTVDIGEIDGAHHITNLVFLFHALNDFRPLIQNQQDCVHYQRLHKTWRGMLVLDDATKGTRIEVIGEGIGDVTKLFVRSLDERNKAITTICGALEFDYLYNGVLQHTDERFSERFLADYTSGQFNYILWKHVLALDLVRRLLSPFYLLAIQLTFPSMGPL